MILRNQVQDLMCIASSLLKIKKTGITAYVKRKVPKAKFVLQGQGASEIARVQRVQHTSYDQKFCQWWMLPAQKNTRTARYENYGCCGEYARSPPKAPKPKHQKEHALRYPCCRINLAICLVFAFFFLLRKNQWMDWLVQPFLVSHQVLSGEWQSSRCLQGMGISWGRMLGILSMDGDGDLSVNTRRETARRKKGILDLGILDLKYFMGWRENRPGWRL